MLFDNRSYSCFRRYLGDLVKRNREEVEALGVNIDDIGVHSIRRDAATYCCAGTTAAPNIAAVCNHSGWTMGKVKDTYIQYGEAGDQHVGRVVAGLPVLHVSCTCSPPYFCIDDSESANECTCTSSDANDLLAMFSPYEIYIQFKPVAKYSAAALLYAYDYFDKMLP